MRMIVLSSWSMSASNACKGVAHLHRTEAAGRSVAPRQGLGALVAPRCADRVAGLSRQAGQVLAAQTLRTDVPRPGADIRPDTLRQSGRELLI
jgi:hypothetical protein